MEPRNPILNWKKYFHAHSKLRKWMTKSKHWKVAIKNNLLNKRLKLFFSYSMALRVYTERYIQQNANCLKTKMCIFDASFHFAENFYWFQRMHNNNHILESFSLNDLLCIRAWGMIMHKCHGKWWWPSLTLKLHNVQSIEFQC